jgi:hypothetical protein
VLGNSEPGRQDRLDSGSGNVENVGIVLSKPNHTTITEKSVAGYLCAGLLGCGIAIYETGGEGGIRVQPFPLCIENSAAYQLNAGKPLPTYGFERYYGLLFCIPVYTLARSGGCFSRTMTYYIRGAPFLV